MKKTVEISTPDENAACTIGETVVLSFEITNLAPKRSEFGAQFITESSGIDDWLSIKGSKTKRVGPNETERFDILVSVPESGMPGQHEFKLLVFDTKFPGEIFEESIPVTVDVKAKPIQEVGIPEAPVLRRSWGKTISVLIGTIVAAFLYVTIVDTLPGASANGVVFYIALILVMMFGIVLSVMTRLNKRIDQMAIAAAAFYCVIFLIMFL